MSLWIWGGIAAFVIVGLAAVCWLSDRDLTVLGEENARLRRDLEDAEDRLTQLDRLDRVGTHAPTRIYRTIPPVKLPDRERTSL